MKRRVALVSGDFVPTGGMDMPNLKLATFLVQEGHAVDVVAHRMDPGLAAFSNVHFHRAPKPLSSYFLGSPLLDRLGRRVADTVLRAGGRVVVNGGNCDVHDVSWVHYVHAAYGRSDATKPWRLAKQGLERRVELARERRVVGAARLVIANSERTKADLVSRLDADPDRIRVIYYGVDGALFRARSADERRAVRRELGLPDGPTLVFVGALGDRRKGFDTLFEAWRGLARRNWDAILLVAGSGAALPRWREEARRAGLERSIHFLGFQRDIPRILAAADAMVAPTRYEAFGQAVHEALCAGLPALVTESAGVVERFSAELRALTLADPNSASELARKLEHWRDHAHELGDCARAHARSIGQRGWDVMNAELYAALELDAGQGGR